ncbi:Elongator subunit elp4 [Phlyctochytrium bullatum]|nr:Elongator subunit elp4 [Phlyctochytrium bullatum]
MSSRISPHNGALQTSFGIPSIDGVLGGGLTTGTVLLIQKDRSTGYAALLHRYFVAQGAAAGHSLFFASAADEDPEEFIASLMAPVGMEAEAEDHGEEDEAAPVGRGQGRQLGALRDGGGERMSIAWRYQNLPKVSTAVAGAARTRTGPGPYCFKFDITKTIPRATLEATSKLSLFKVSDCTRDGLTAAEIYERLYLKIKEFAESGPYKARPSDAGSNRKILRIALSSVGSSLWGIDAGSKAAINALYRFILSLRALLRNYDSVCVITIPGGSYGDEFGVSSAYAIRRLYHASDGALEVESFGGSSRHFPSAYTTDYHGLLHVHRLPTPNTLTPGTPLSASELHSLAFRVRRKRFTIEPFQLPPEFEEEDKKKAPPVATSTGDSGGKAGPKRIVASSSVVRTSSSSTPSTASSGPQPSQLQAKSSKLDF